MGRKSVLDAHKQGQICALLALGCSRTTAAHHVGCAISTIRHTAMHNRQFREQLRAAERQAETAPLHSLRAQATKNWRAAAWLLERTMPHKYARRKADVIDLNLAIQVLHDQCAAMIAETPGKKAQNRVRRLFARRALLTAKSLRAAADPLRDGRRHRGATLDPKAQGIDDVNLVADLFGVSESDLEDPVLKSLRASNNSEDTRPLSGGPLLREPASNNPENSRPEARDYISPATAPDSDPDIEAGNGGATHGSHRARASTVHAADWGQVAGERRETQHNSPTFVGDKTAQAATCASESDPQRDPLRNSNDRSPDAQPKAGTFVVTDPLRTEDNGEPTNGNLGN